MGHLNLGYLIALLMVLTISILLRMFLKTPSLGKPKQKFVFFLLTYSTTFLWDNIAVPLKHWQYKNLIGIYIGYSPIENILFAVAFPIGVITIYQILARPLAKQK